MAIFRKCFLPLIYGTFLFFQTNVAQAGWLAVVGTHWKTFSFEPKDDEKTPNYYGFGARLGLGYSFNQVFDVDLWGEYTPGRLKSAEIGIEDSVLGGYGGELAFRIQKTIFIGLRGGGFFYNLVSQKDENEIDGRWAGVGGILSIGASFANSKESFWQVTLDSSYISLSAEESTEGEEEDRVINAFSVSLAYAFNQYRTSRPSGFFGNFLDSLGF